MKNVDTLACFSDRCSISQINLFNSHKIWIGNSYIRDKKHMYFPRRPEHAFAAFNDYFYLYSQQSILQGPGGTDDLTFGSWILTSCVSGCGPCSCSSASCLYSYKQEVNVTQDCKWLNRHNGIFNDFMEQLLGTDRLKKP